MRHRNGWRAGYAETCKSGSAGGSEKPGLETDKGARFLPNSHGSVREKLTYKAERLGMEVFLQEEAYAE